MVKFFYLIGSILVIIGIIHTMILPNIISTSSNLYVNSSHYMLLNVNTINYDMGFYEIILMDSNDDLLFVQIIDPYGNVIDEKKIKTKMSINYFDLEYNGTYVIKITNLTDIAKIKIQIGKISVDNVIYSTIILSSGIIIFVVLLYIKLKSYKIAHPTKNIL